MEAIAKLSYLAKASNELSFQRGDVLRVVNVEDDVNWFVAEFEGKKGWVPSNYVNMECHEWYQGKITRADSEKLLMKQRKGSFLVRLSESYPGDFSISVRCSNGVQHLKVLRDAQAKFFIWDLKFNSLNEIIDHHRKTSILYTENVKLGYMRPQMLAPKPMVIALYDFTPQEDGELAFKQGDIITVTNSLDGHWWRGELGSNEGLFPASYVSPYTAT